MTPAKKMALAALACVFPIADAAEAQEFTPIITGGGAGSRTDVAGYIGLSFSFGSNAPKKPQVVVGVQQRKVNSDDQLRGLDLNARFGLDGGLDRVALSGLTGRRDIYANLGFGYDFNAGGFIGTAALQGSYLRAGADYDIATGDVRPYVEVNSLATPKRVAGSGTLGCATQGYIPYTEAEADLAGLGGIYDQLVGDGLDLDGRVCLAALD